MGPRCACNKTFYELYFQLKWMFSWGFLILLKMHFCLIIPSALVVVIAVYLQVLYREVVIYSLFSTERKIKAGSGTS